MATFCYQCIHVSMEGGEDNWERWKCTAQTLPTSTNYLTGKQDRIRYGQVTTDTYAYCRDVNEGDCDKFHDRKDRKPAPPEDEK